MLIYSMVYWNYERKNIMGTLQYRIKQVYGKDTMYPANEIANHIAALAQRKTLDTVHLDLAIKLGYNIERVF